MVISADFEKQNQYFVKKNYCFVTISLYRNMACKKCSSDEGLRKRKTLKYVEKYLIALAYILTTVNTG